MATTQTTLNNHQVVKPRSGYAMNEITKAPNWHGLVAWDLLFNNLTTGLFLVMALGELVNPAAFRPLGKVAYPAALLILLADLSCLVLDLGNPLKFHHMLRVFKPSSPMSLGTWCLTVYSLPLTALAAIDLLTALGFLPTDVNIIAIFRQACVIGGLLPALGSAAYKGVLFSTSSQPAWKDGRWLGAYLVNSALMLGCAEAVAIARLTGQGRAAGLLGPVMAILLALNALPLALLVYDFHASLRRTYSVARLAWLALLAVGVGLLAPLLLPLAMSGVWASLLTLGLLVVGGMTIRWTIVKLPHAAHEHQPVH